jgi:predicted NUDIX family NTP pyrophosphohydrolase
MNKKSAGILAYRITDGVPEVLLVHPGGPFFVKKDEGVWSVPKGEFEDDEEPLAAAKREFAEETGSEIDGDFKALQPVVQKSGKTVYAWSVAAQTLDMSAFKSNEFSMEWPIKSGNFRKFPEVDKAEWFTIAAAKTKLNIAQVPLLDELAAQLT